MTGHCFRCGAAFAVAPPADFPLVAVGKICQVCGYEQYLNARPTGGLVILNEAREFLAVRRVRPPQQGMWELPGGFCDAWEEPIAAAAREGREELGVDVEIGPFLGMYIGRYEFQGETLPVLDCFWAATLREGTTFTLDPDEVGEWRWFSLDDPPALAFSTMVHAVQEAALFRPNKVRHGDHSTKGQLVE